MCMYNSVLLICMQSRGLFTSQRHIPPFSLFLQGLEAAGNSHTTGGSLLTSSGHSLLPGSMTALFSRARLCPPAHKHDFKAGSTAVCGSILTGQVPDLNELPLHKHMQTAVEGPSMVSGEGKQPTSNTGFRFIQN